MLKEHAVKRKATWTLHALKNHPYHRKKEEKSFTGERGSKQGGNIHPD